MWNDLGPIASTLATIVVSVPPANAPATACLSRSGVSASPTSGMAQARATPARSVPVAVLLTRELMWEE